MPQLAQDVIRKRSEWHRNSVELRADIGRIGRTELLCDVAVEVVQHEADIAVGVPVQRRGVDRLSSAGDAVCAGKLIVQIDGREAGGDLPRAPAAARELERVGRDDPVVSGTRRIVGAGLAGQ